MAKIDYMPTIPAEVMARYMIDEVVKEFKARWDQYVGSQFEGIGEVVYGALMRGRCYGSMFAAIYYMTKGCVEVTETVTNNTVKIELRDVELKIRTQCKEYQRYTATIGQQ